ncbi:MAG: hypothetical protein WCP79_14445, partial [Bacillota bacterium]
MLQLICRHNRRNWNSHCTRRQILINSALNSPKGEPPQNNHTNKTPLERLITSGWLFCAAINAFDCNRSILTKILSLEQRLVGFVASQQIAMAAFA